MREAEPQQQQQQQQQKRLRMLLPSRIDLLQREKRDITVESLRKVVG